MAVHDVLDGITSDCAAANAVKSVQVQDPLLFSLEASQKFNDLMQFKMAAKNHFLFDQDRDAHLIGECFLQLHELAILPLVEESAVKRILASKIRRHFELELHGFIMGLILAATAHDVLRV